MTLFYSTLVFPLQSVNIYSLLEGGWNAGAAYGNDKPFDVSDRLARYPEPKSLEQLLAQPSDVIDGCSSKHATSSSTRTKPLLFKADGAGSRATSSSMSK